MKKRRYEFFKIALKSPKPVSFQGANSRFSALGGCPRGGEMTRAKGCQRFRHSPQGGHIPVSSSSPLETASGNDYQARALLASAALPFAPLPLSRIPTAEAVAKANTGAASPKRSTVTSSLPPKLELWRVYPPMVQGLEKVGMAGWEYRTHLQQPKRGNS